MREDLRPGFDEVRKALFQFLGDPAMQSLARDAQQGAVGGVLDQRVLEYVDRFRWCPSLRDQLGGDKLGERGLQVDVRKTGDGAQQRIGKLASNRCADLRHWPYRGQAVEPRQ